MEKKQYTVLEHYVPKCYLKQFSEQEDKAYFAYCLFKKTNVLKRINIDKICAVNDLYELVVFDEYVDRNIIEDGFVDLEAKYSSLCRDIMGKVSSCHEIVLPQDGFELLKNFYVFLFQRSKFAIHLLELIGNMIMEENPIDIEPIKDILPDMDESTINTEIAPYMNECMSLLIAHHFMKLFLDTKNLSKVVPAIGEMLGEGYCFLHNADKSFIISDTPTVALLEQDEFDFLPKEIYCMPLAPDCCMVFCHDETIVGKIFSVNQTQVETINQRQFTFRSEIIISHNHQNLLKYIKP